MAGEKIPYTPLFFDLKKSLITFFLQTHFKSGEWNCFKLLVYPRGNRRSANGQTPIQWRRSPIFQIPRRISVRRPVPAACGVVLCFLIPSERKTAMPTFNPSDKTAALMIALLAQLACLHAAERATFAPVQRDLTLAAQSRLMLTQPKEEDSATNHALHVKRGVTQLPGGGGVNGVADLEDIPEIAA